MAWTSLAILAVAAVACQQPQPPRGKRVEYRDLISQSVELIDSAVTLGDTDTWIAVEPPLKIAFPFSSLCVEIPGGYRQSYMPLALFAPSGEKVVISAQVKLSDGSAVPMQFSGLSAGRTPTGEGGQYCLKSYMFSEKEGEGFSVGTIITGLTLRSSLPMTTRHVRWNSGS